MKHIRFACILLTLSLAGAAAQAASTVIRTLVYHEITSFTSATVVNSTPVLSDSGNRAAFAQAPGPEPTRTTHVFVINADGTGQHEVDTYPQLCFCGAELDISADGSRVLSTDGIQIRMVNADGTNPHEVIRINGGSIQFRLSADGTKVFFTDDRDFSVGSETLTAGLYVIDADGRNRRQIVSAAQIWALLGPPGFFSPVSTSGPSLDASSDTSRLIFGTRIEGKGQYILGVNFDGGGLHQILGPVPVPLGVEHAAISGDGSKVGYDIGVPPCCSTPNEAGVINFDGTQKKPLVTNIRPFSAFWPGTADPMQLSADGSRLLLGKGLLINTATKETLQLAALGQFFINGPLAYEGMEPATMNSSATRFLYLSGDANFVKQLATMDINPGSLGPSPSVTDPKLDPTFVITQGRSTATISARVTAANTLVIVNNVALRNGINDGNVRGVVLGDTGANGDTTAGDGIFTNNGVDANSDAVVGPRVMRVKAEVRASDGKRHATAIDFEPFSVTDRAPSIDVSQTSLDFGNVIVGQSKDLTFTIRNIGTGPLTINSLTSNDSQFSVPAPAAPFTILAGGQQIVTVRFTPTSVGPQGARLTINSSDSARPAIDVFLSGVGVVPSFSVIDHRVTGGPIPAECGPPIAKTTFASTDQRAYQWTFVSGFQSGAVVRWEWVQPNGSIYRQVQYPVINSASDVCFWEVLDIAGQPAASLPGNWQVRVFYNGALIVTDNFTISSGGGQFRLLDHRMTGGPILANCGAPTAKNTFAPTDPVAYQWTFVSGFQSGDVVRWEWIQPNGSIYRQVQGPVINSASDVCFWEVMDIAGQPPASLPGNWQVRVFYNGTLIVTENFTISGGGGGGGTFCFNMLAGGSPPGALQPFYFGVLTLGFAAVRPTFSGNEILPPAVVTAMTADLNATASGVSLVSGCIRFDTSRFTALAGQLSGMTGTQAESAVSQLIQDLQQAIRQSGLSCTGTGTTAFEAFYLAVLNIGYAEARAAEFTCRPLPAAVVAAIMSDLTTARASLMPFASCLPGFDFGVFDRLRVGPPFQSIETYVDMVGLETGVRSALCNSACCCTCQASGLLLAIRPVVSQGSISIAFPADATNFVVQSANSLSTRDWTNLTFTATPTNGQLILIQPIAGPRKFYRLLKP